MLKPCNDWLKQKDIDKIEDITIDWTIPYLLNTGDILDCSNLFDEKFITAFWEGKII